MGIWSAGTSCFPLTRNTNDRNASKHVFSICTVKRNGNRKELKFQKQMQGLRIEMQA